MTEKEDKSNQLKNQEIISNRCCKKIKEVQDIEEKCYTYIYGLECPITNKIRYIGKSDHPKQRFLGHLALSKADVNMHKKQWIKKVLKSGKKPILRILEKVNYSNWESAEKKWIKKGRNNSWGLTNIADGGVYSDLPCSDINISCIICLYKFAEKKYIDMINELDMEIVARILIKAAKGSYKFFFGIGCERDGLKAEYYKTKIINEELSQLYRKDR